MKEVLQWSKEETKKIIGRYRKLANLPQEEMQQIVDEEEAEKERKARLKWNRYSCFWHILRGWLRGTL